MIEPLVLDNTKRAAFRQCKAKYNIQHNHGLQSNFGSTAIRFGVCYHAIQEGYHRHLLEHGNASLIEALTAGLEFGKKEYEKLSETKTFIDDYKNFNTAADCFNEYLDFFADDLSHIKIIGTEKRFECQITADNEQEDKVLSILPPIIFTGKIDLQVEMDHMKWIWDFKTTGWSLDQVVMKTGRLAQTIGYSYAADKVLDFEPNGCLISIAYINAYKKKDGTYGDTKFDFRRVPLIYNEGDLRAWKLAFIDTCVDIIRATDENLWPESFDNCYQFGACPYIRLCNQHVPVEEMNTEGFHVSFWNVLDED